MPKSTPEEALKRVLDLWLGGETVDRACHRVQREYSLPKATTTIRRDYFRWKAEQTHIPSIKPEIPPVARIDWPGPVTILADMHLPYCHSPTLAQALAHAESEGIETCIFLGDTLDNDYCSQFMDPVAPGDAASVNRHIEAIYGVLNEIAAVFKTIHVVRGNHDDRALKAMNRLWGLDHIFRIFTTMPGKPSIYHRFSITERYWMLIENSPAGTWRLTHQKEYSRIPGRIAQRYVEKKHYNVVTSHCHDQAKIVMPGGHYAVAPGCVQDPLAAEYNVIRDTLHPDWVVGWATIDDEGVPHIHGPR